MTSMIRILRLVLCVCLLFPTIAWGDQEARYYTPLPGKQVQCDLCPRACLLAPGQTGTCTDRRNIDGKLISLVYAQVVSWHVDPVEKKPLFHCIPGSPTYSIATAGCNLRCSFCQNWSISQVSPEQLKAEKMPPEDVVRRARAAQCQSISYTYSEPTAYYEFMYDTAFLARQHGLKNFVVTSGYINPEPATQLCAVIDAANVDLKGFSDASYRTMCAAKLSPILESLRVFKKGGVWLEVGYLIVPTINDSDEELRLFASWVRYNLGAGTPVHFLRFFPQHRLNALPPTPVSTMERALSIAQKAGLEFVYIGNVPGHRANNTWCPQCKKLLIERKGYYVEQNNIINGTCKYCGRVIPGIWK